MSSTSSWQAGAEREATDEMVDQKRRTSSAAGETARSEAVNAGALVPVRGGEVRAMVPARPGPRRQMMHALSASLPAIGRVMRIAGPALLTVATSEVLRRLSEQRAIVPMLHAGPKQAETCPADQAAVIVVQIVTCVLPPQ